ncbi:hypothetical protein [Streptomyces sp. NPDC007984]|uniref:hypothetical protein n=1 Tax=Streptomyces sp. NPDC007984 TaxID=3364801 RepID=UPI0036F0C750
MTTTGRSAGVGAGAGPSASADPLSGDLAEVSGSVLEREEDRIRDGILRVRTDFGAAPVTGDPLLLEQMIGNLVDNAVKYNRNGGVLKVRTGRTAAALAHTVS